MYWVILLQKGVMSHQPLYNWMLQTILDTLLEGMSFTQIVKKTMLSFAVAIVLGVALSVQGQG